MTSRIDEIWNWIDPRQTELRFREELAQSTGDTAAEIRTQIARALGLQGRYSDGQAVLDAITSTCARVQIRVELERGRLLNSSGNPAAAIEHFQAAAQLAGVAGEVGLEIDALHMFGIAAPPEDRLAWNLRAIERARGSNQPEATRWLGSLLNNTAWTEHDAGNVPEALRLFEEALAWNMEFGSEETIRIARWSVARAMRSLGRFEEALTIQIELADADSADGYVHEEVAENLLALGRPEEAQFWFRRALALLSNDEWLVSNESERLERLRRLSGNQE